MMGFLDNLEEYIDFTEDIDKDPDMEPISGYSTGKWSDDDDFGITPFLGPNR
jgi:hypothetical protein